MSQEKVWQSELILKLASGLFLALAALSLAGLALHTFHPPAEDGALRLVDFMVSSFGFHALALGLVDWFLKRHEMSWAEFLGLTQSGRRRAWLAGILTGLVVLLPVLGMKSLCAWAMTLVELPLEEQAPVQMIQQVQDWSHFVWLGLAALVFAPLVEEILFRGILYRFIQQAGFPQVARTLSAILFAAIHANLVTFLPLTVLALCFIWLYDRTGNLLAPILAHATFNAVNFGLLVYQTASGSLPTL